MTQTGGVVAFGELMLRLTTRRHERFVQARDFDVRYTGAEANVAVSLAGFGVTAAVVSRVPEHEIGQACINYLRQFGVDTTHVVRGGERLGLLYVEQGASQRSSSVIYDREHSAFQEAQPEDFDWDAILAGRQWLHWSGTAPSRGANLVEIVGQACDAAHRLGLTVSCDVNYRSRLWSVAEAAPVMTALMERVDVAFAGPEDASALFGVCAHGDDPGDAARAMFLLLAGFREVEADILDIEWDVPRRQEGTPRSAGGSPGQWKRERTAEARVPARASCCAQRGSRASRTSEGSTPAPGRG